MRGETGDAHFGWRPMRAVWRGRPPPFAAVCHKQQGYAQRVEWLQKIPKRSSERRWWV